MNTGVDDCLIGGIINPLLTIIKDGEVGSDEGRGNATGRGPERDRASLLLVQLHHHNLHTQHLHQHDDHTTPSINTTNAQHPPST